HPAVVPCQELSRERSCGRTRVKRLDDSAVRKGCRERSGPDRYPVTEAGLRRAAEVARSHRLWALFLTEYADLAAGTANLAEESVESLLSPDMVADLHRKLEQQDRMPAVNHPEARG